MKLREFCGSSEFWNSTLLLESSWPQLTECFLNTIVAWNPSFFLWLSLPWHLYKMRRGKDETSLPITGLNAAKTACSALLAVLAMVMAICDGIGQATGHHLPVAVVLADVSRFLAYASAVVLTQFERRRHVFTSCLQFSFWVLFVICDVIWLYSFVMTEEHTSNMVKLVLMSVTLALEVSQVVLFSFSEAPRTTLTPAYQSLEKTACPTITASCLNQLLTFWMTRYVFRGWRRDLEPEDLFHLNTSESSDALMPPFERAWDLEVKRFQSKRSKDSFKKRENNSSEQDDQSRDQTDQSSSERDVTNKCFNGPAQSDKTKDSGQRETSFLVDNKKRRPSTSPTSQTKATYGADDKRDTEKKKTAPCPSLLRVMWKLEGIHLMLSFMGKIIFDILMILGPVLLGLLIQYVSRNDNKKRAWHGYGLAVVILLTELVKCFIFTLSLWTCQMVGLRLKSMLVSAVYKKSLTMSNEARCQFTAGAILSLVSVDCERIQTVLSLMFMGCTSPVQFVVVLVVLYQYIGVSLFAGVLTLMVLIPVNYYVAFRQKTLSRANLAFKDERLRLTGEVLSGIKLLKLYAWEPLFETKIRKVREDETGLLLKIAYLNVLNDVIMNFVPFLVTLVTFATFIESSPDNVLDAQRAFVTLAMFAIIRVPLVQFSFAVIMSVQTMVSVRRINAFLVVEDLDHSVVTFDGKAADAVCVKKGTFSWEKGAQPTLKNINAKVSEGRMGAIVGQVGSGKSSLLSALLGEMHTTSGHITLKNSVAYVPQQAWIQNATVRDNILFGTAYHEQRYHEVIHACALGRDLESFPAGDLTEIGEKGINLSGGQKQRVSLARAVYSDKHIVFLDDPLSAVDSHVGKHIFRHVLGPHGLLKAKTRLLVTHDVHWLPVVDEVWVMSDGCLVQQGTYQQLLSQDSPLIHFLQRRLFEEDSDDSCDDDDDDGVLDPEISRLKQKVRSDVIIATSGTDMSSDEVTVLTTNSERKRRKTRSSSASTKEKDKSSKHEATDNGETVKDIGRLTEEEHTEKGKVKNRVFLAYLRSAGVLPVVVSMVFLLMFYAANAGSYAWLSRWTDDPSLTSAALTNQNSSSIQDYRAKCKYYLAIYGLFGAVQVVMLLISDLVYWVRTVEASKKLHNQLLASILRSSPSFFDTTPSGRVLNRFSRDLECIDANLPNVVKMFLGAAIETVISVLVISISTPPFILLALPMLVLYLVVQSFYIPTSRQLKRLESVSKSPLYSHLSESLTGGSSIRAYKASQRFLQRTRHLVDDNQAYFFAIVAANRWLSTSLRLISSLIVFGATLFAVTTPDIGGGTVGLSVSYAFQVTAVLIWAVRQLSDFQTYMVSVERVREYTELLPEAPWTDCEVRPAANWPSSGRLTFDRYSTCYRTGLDLVLKDVTLSMEAGQKVAVVGRTGAGKSSLTLSLVRIVEASGGSIVIDGINIAHIGLHDLRTKITVLPQDPILFSGTLRTNLDPIGQCTDHQLWTALDRVHLKSFIEGLPGGLNCSTGDGGQSFSLGQRQLVCLARTLLRGSKIIVLDEATAAVDMETDSLIQGTIRTAFAHCTVITIAHRLHTIMDYDRILVLDGGMAKEYDTPHRLLSDSSSLFYSMAADAGLV